MKNRCRVLLFSILLTPTIIFAQTDDYGLWTTIGLKKKWGKFNLGTEGEYRSKNNAQTIDRWSFKVEPSYSIIKPLQVGLGYELYYNDTKYFDFQPRHRGYLFVTGKQKWGRFSFSLRERVQVTKKDDSDRIKKSGKINSYAINPEWVWRNRLKLDYNLPKLPISPYLSVESFYILNNPEGNEFYKMRYSTGIKYDLTKHHQFEIYGLLDKVISLEEKYNTYILGLSYCYNF